MPVRIIKLSNSSRVALIDDSDLLRISKYQWSIDQRKHTAYAKAHPRDSSPIYLHRTVMSAKPGQQIDHANGDGLDCRRINLRLCTSTQNRQNQRKTRGKSKYSQITTKCLSWANCDESFKPSTLQGRDNMG